MLYDRELMLAMANNSCSDMCHRKKKFVTEGTMSRIGRAAEWDICARWSKSGVLERLKIAGKTVNFMHLIRTRWL